MALAPRAKAPATNPTRRKSSAHDKDFKREQRARNGTRSGSSGVGQKVAPLPKTPFDDVAEYASHVADITGKISHSQFGAGGTMSVTMQIPKEYAHEALDAHMASADGLVHIRVYGVSFSDYLKASGLASDADLENPDFDPFEVV